ncbi:glycerol dehydrogenase [Muricomes sp. OA1]|uniref:Glycerol dehydrogenase n=1 Tax=Hungatella hathewayi TaxID=154046 RepID=A0A3E2X2E0_9FIRM|nr:MULTISPECIES: glycerol dehydrogenase [Clostridia]MCH1971515.1 glycerol dehydrogenase [Muricomes sp. OA1]RGC35661.1 glycerol dehydrogenase [Hungatella hathewayi]GKH34815.1 glycerol dehydrogenase [Faecalicatena contorta]
MRRNTNYRAWGSVGHYIQGPGLLEEIESYASEFGQAHFYIIDVFFYDEWKEKLKALYRNSKSTFSCGAYEGEITHRKIAEFQKQAVGTEIDTVIAIGGGKSIDAAKVTAARMDCALLICPTIASTDAPTSAMSILYSEDGKMNEIMLHKRNPDLVLADSRIIAQAPARFLTAGMGDALSTYFEGLSNIQSGHENYVWCDKKPFVSTVSGRAIAKCCYETLIQDGYAAKLACERHLCVPALENIIECNILMSGLGFENVGCSIAHAIGNAITVLPEGENLMHGERVGFGVICQLAAEHYDTKTLEEVLNFCIMIGIPVCFEDMSIELTEENLQQIAEESLEADSWQACSRTCQKEDIVQIMKIADAFGCDYKKKHAVK